MGPEPRWRSAAASDTGRVRARNEDRYWIDDERGIFLVVDGVGGQAAGELAAQTAVEVIRDGMLSGNSPPEERIVRAITHANNRIFDLAAGDDRLSGMACVLTLAVVNDGQITIGHVGDSRLYLIWNGAIRKLTSDHSPVGEGEDAGELSEDEAMRHPRRHEVFRDVGSQRRTCGERFIEIRRCHFKPDAAFLICSDGLTDQVTAAEVREIVDRYEGDAKRTAAALVGAAIASGGRDNITVLFVAGPLFRGCQAADTVEIPARLPGMPPRQRPWVGLLTDRMAFLIYGLLIGMLVWAVLSGSKG
jgi:PPM family protein phosphatase